MPWLGEKEWSWQFAKGRKVCVSSMAGGDFECFMTDTPIWIFSPFTCSCSQSSLLLYSAMTSRVSGTET